MSRRRHQASSATAAAMPLEELERWLQARAERRPVATSIAMLDGYVTGIVAGPVSINPLDWICPLLAVDAMLSTTAARRSSQRSPLSRGIATRPATCPRPRPNSQRAMTHACAGSSTGFMPIFQSSWRHPPILDADPLRSRELITDDAVRRDYGQGTNPLSWECGLREGGASAAIATSHDVYAAAR